MDKIQVLSQGNGLYTIILGDGMKTENLSREDAETFVRNQEGMTEEKVASIFGSSAEPAKVSQNQKVNGQPNSVFAGAKAKTGLSNAGDVKTPEQYKQMEKEIAANLKSKVGYDDAAAAAHAKGMVQTQIAADRVESSVYFTPDKKEEFEKQKEQLEKEGKRPVLLTKDDMELLHSDNFVLRNGESEPIDKDGKVIDPNDPNAESKYVRAFNEDGTLNQEMVKLISAQRVGSDNELVLEERQAETEKFIGGKLTTDKLMKSSNLYERLGYDVQKDDAIEVDAAGLAAAGKKGKRRGAFFGFLAGLAVAIGSMFTARALSKHTELEKTGEEEVKLPDQTVDGGQSTNTTITPGTEGYYDPDTVIGDTFGGGTGSQTIPGAWHEGTPGDTITETVDNPDITIEGGSYMRDVYGEVTKQWSYGKSALPGLGAVPLGIALGADAGKNKAEKDYIANAVKDAVDRKENDILGEMNHRQFVADAYSNGNYLGVKGESNQKMMEYVINKAKEKGMTEDQFMEFMTHAQGGPNEVLEEKELLAMFKEIDSYTPPTKPEEVEETDNLEEEDIDPGKTPEFEGDEATVHDRPEIRVKNVPYKMQKGDVIANVIKAKYGITDPKDLREAIILVRRATGMNDNGSTGRKVEVNGKMVWEPQIATIEVDGQKLIDAYFLPETLTIGDKTYDLDRTKDGAKSDYSKIGQGIQGNNNEQVLRPTEYQTTANSDGTVLQDWTPDKSVAESVRDKYNEEHKKK